MTPRALFSPPTRRTPRADWRLRRETRSVSPLCRHAQRYRCGKRTSRKHYRSRSNPSRRYSHCYPSPPHRCRRRDDFWRSEKRRNDHPTKLERMFSSLSVTDHDGDSEEFTSHCQRGEFQMFSRGSKGKPCSRCVDCESRSPASIESRKTLRPQSSQVSPSSTRTKDLLLSSAYAQPPSPPTAAHSLLPTLIHPERQDRRRNYNHNLTTASKLEEMERLLQMIRQNPDRCKELAELVCKFLKRHPKTSRETTSLCHGTGYTSYISYEADHELSPVALKVATVAGGGNSPPRPPHDGFKGHMVDDASTVLSTCASGPTTRAPSAIVDDVRRMFFPNSVVVQLAMQRTK